LDTGKRTIRVMHLIGSTGLYGAERWVLALMRAMDPQVICSTLVNLVDDVDEQSAIVLAAKDRGLDAIDFVTGGRFNPFAAIRLSRWSREHQVDIIHCHGFKSDLLGLLTSMIFGCRILTTPHGWGLENNIKLKFYEILDCYIFRFIDIVCPLSKELYNNINNRTKARMQLILNGVDIDEVMTADKIDISNDGSYIIGYIGRLVKSKDLVTLLNATKLLFDSGKFIRLVIVGDGDHAEELKEITRNYGIENIVDFYGYRADAVNFLKGFDCFVLPSLSEGTPRCVMEAMALNIPVVVSDIPGNRNLVTHSETGFLFPVGDSKILYEYISYVMDHPDDVKKMTDQGFKKIYEDYSSNKMAKEYSTVYKGLLNN